MITLLSVIQSVGFLAVSGTQEVSLQYLAALIGAGTIAMLFKLKLKDQWIALAIFLAILGAASMIIKQNFDPIVASAYGIIPVHVMLWFSNDPKRIQRWLMVISFFEITLSAAISPDFYLAVLILLYSMLSQHYLMRQAAELSRFTTVPKHASRFIHVTSISSIIMALILFPFLPRSHQAFEDSWQSTKLGYTETVDLNRSTRITEGPTRTALRIFVNETEFPLIGKLLRARVLDHFSGTEWFPSLKRKTINAYSLDTPENATEVTIIRDPIDSPVIPVPYGAAKTVLEGSGTSLSLQRTSSDEWMAPFSERNRIKYRVYLGTDNPSDAPNSASTKVVPNAVSSRFIKWVEQTIPNQLSPGEKAFRILSHFRKQGFTVSLEPVAPYQSFSVLDRFFFIEKAGNCELFATAAAMALRLSGVPARLVSGFKIARPPVGGFVNILVQDAHAWVEYWNPNTKAWQSLDPTPAVVGGYSFVDQWIDRIELAKSFWYQYIISYESENISQFVGKDKKNSKNTLNTPKDESERSIFESPYWIGAIFLIALLFILSAVRMIPQLRFELRQKRNDYRVRLLNSELDRFEELSKHVAAISGSNAHLQDLISDWKEYYNNYRFSPKEYHIQQALTELKVLRLGIERISQPFAYKVQEREGYE